jgi:aspartyl-tRNA(Asn)/glutamyl-tRNA(Gln) amidotransferase subunit A
MAGPDPKDTTCADIPVPDYEAAVGKSVKGLRIGIPKEYRLDGMPAEIEKIWEKGREWLKPRAPNWSTSLCRTPNMPCRPITSLRLLKPRPISRAMTACATDFASPLARSLTCMRRLAATASAPEVRRRVMIGTYVLSAGYYDAYYLRAQKVRTLIKKDFEDCFKAGVHAMLTPATPSAAFGLGEKGGADPSRCISTTCLR